MRKTLITLLLISPILFASGQAAYNDSKEDFLASIQKSKKFRAHVTAAGIKSAQRFEYKHNDSTGILTYEYKYDNRGNNTDWFEYRKNGKVKSHMATGYNDSNWITQFEYYNRAGKATWLDTFTYDKRGNQVEIGIYNENPKKLYSKTISTYDSLNNITESKVYGKRNKPESRIEYTYYTDGSKKQTIEYSGNGKVKNIWNFDCNPVGNSQAQKLKDTSKVCIHYETDKDGKPIKIKEEYKGQDGLFGKSMRRTITKYDKDNNILDLSTYKLNGRQTLHWGATYNAMGRLTEYDLYGLETQKIWWKYTYNYNSDGLIAAAAIYKKSKGTPEEAYKWVYNASK